MSILTDVASLKIIAHIYKRPNLQSMFDKTVVSLVEEVPYIDWAGIYLYDQEELNLIAASDFSDDLNWSCEAELKFPIFNQLEEEIGVVVIRSLQAIAFDITDISTMETIAKILGEEGSAH